MKSTMLSHSGLAILASALLVFSGSLFAEAGADEKATDEAEKTARTVPEFSGDNGRVTVTGSRIPRDADQIFLQGGRLTTTGVTIYTREDIERTGAIDLQDALRRMDPRFH